EEITKSLVEIGAVAKELIYSGADALRRMEVPETIQEVISARIDHLEEGVKRTLREASVFGREFSLPLLQRVSAEKEKLNQHVKELEGAEFIYEKSHFPDPIYSFRHTFIQEVAYGGLLLKRRRELHRAVASAIGELYPERLEENWGILAHHYYFADAWERALEFQVKAGNKAKEAYANEEAADYYRRAIRAFGKLGPEEKAKNTGFNIQARAGLSSVYFFTAEYEKSIRENEILLALLEEEDPAREKWPLEWARTKARVGMALERRGKFEDGLRMLLEAREVLEACPEGEESSVEMSRCLGQLSWIHFRMHDSQGARRWAYESLRLAEKLGSLPDITRAHNVLGASFVRDGDYQEAIEHFEKCLENEEALEHLPGKATLLYNLGLVACLRGSYGEAVEYYQKAREIRRQVGDALGTGSSLNSLGNVYHCLDKLDEALECYRESLEFREEIKHTEGVAVTLEHLGRALMEKGDLGEAVRILRKSLEVGEQIQSRVRMSEAYLSLAYTLAATGEYEEARKCAEEAARKKHGHDGADDEIRKILERLQDASLKDLSKEKLIRDRRSLHAWV
ncbi:MAG: tetratricopeptide repeat protein, partial [Nitrospinota bacterium]